MTIHAKTGALRSGAATLYRLGRKHLRDAGLKRVISNAAMIMAAKVAGAGAGFCFNVLVARQIGTDSYGLFSYALTLVAMLSVLSASGLNNVTVQFVASYAIEERWELLSGLLRWANLRAIVISGVITAGLIVTTQQSLFHMDERDNLSLLIGSGIVFFGALTVVQAGILRGLKRFVIAELVDVGAGLRSLLSLGAILVMLAYGERLSTADEGMWISTLSAVAAFLFGTVFVFKALPAPLRLQHAEYNRKEWVRTSVPLMLMNAAFLFQSQVDIIMLKHMSTTTEVALFFAAWRIASLVTFPVVSIGAITAPTMIELYTLRKGADLQRLLYQTATITAASAFVVCIVALLWGHKMLSLFGPDFTEGYTVLVILLAGQCVNALAGNLVLLMTVSGHHAAACRIVLVAVTGNVALNLVLIPMLGREGAAWSSLSVSLACGSVMAWTLYRLTGIQASPAGILLEKLNEYRRRTFGSSGD